MCDDAELMAVQRFHSALRSEREDGQNGHFQGDSGCPEAADLPLSDNKKGDHC